MNNFFIFVKRSPAVFIMLAGILVGTAVVVYAQTDDAEGGAHEDISPLSGITFPIPELSDCGSKDECRQYCNDPAHMDACVAFAESHGLMNEEEAVRAKKFRGQLEQGAGPGGCTTPESCKTFCENINNIEACIAFAEENGFEDAHIAESKKILAYIKSGGVMPGGCTGKTECEAYCEDFAHAEECFLFAERAGITSMDGGQGGGPGSRFGKRGPPAPAEFKKLLELIKSGEMPGGCKSKAECESYCRTQGHFEECIQFGTRAGFIDPKHAEKIRETGGKGPGGCDSPDACRAYCAEPSHQEECFRFAEERGFIDEEETARSKEGFVRLRAGLENAPPEVSACLTSVLGPTIIEDIQKGTVTPGPEIGERVRGCFEKFGHESGAEKIFDDAPKEVVSCVREKLGSTFDDIKSGKTPPTPEVADTFRVCFQAMRFEDGMFGGPDESRGAERGGMFRAHEFIRSAPPGIAECLKEKFGIDPSQLGRGMPPEPELEEKMKSCFESFRPERPQFMNPPTDEGSGVRGDEAPDQSGSRAHFSPEVTACLRERVNEEVLSNLMRGSRPSPDIEKVVGACFSAMGQSSGGEFRGDGVSPPVYIQPTFDERLPGTAEGCTDPTSCARVCADTGSPYFGSGECMKFREYQSTQPTSGLPFGRLLGTVLVPFLQIFLR